MFMTLTLYPYFAIILAATPKPVEDGPLSTIGDVPNAEDVGGVGELEVFEVSVREGGGAIAAPPEVAVKKQGQLVS